MMIIKCTSQDIHTLAVLNKRLIEDEKSDNPMSPDELEKRMTDFLSSEYNAYFFKEVEEIVGYALIRHTCTPLYLRQFYIDRTYRRLLANQNAQKKRTIRGYLMIETTRLIIRPFRDEDADALYRIKTDPQVMEFCPDFLDVDAKRKDMDNYIHAFQRIEENGDTDTWRCYAIENKETGLVMGVLTFSKQNMLHEYELGWMMIGEYTGKGYASEAAEAFAEYFCQTHGVDYMVVVMDIDNPASRRTAEKSGFRLFEKRTVYDYHYNQYCDDYLYFRRYWSGCTLKNQYYGDTPYYGRSTSDRNE